MLTVEVYSIAIILNAVFFWRRANITQSTIFLSVLNAGSFPIPGVTSEPFIRVEIRGVY